MRWLLDTPDEARWLYRNKNGHWALDPEVLDAFHRAHAGHEIKWNKHASAWWLLDE